MYRSSLQFRRTTEEKSDPFLSWGRDDLSFFAAGACHILAYMFMQLHPNQNFQIIFLKPEKKFTGNHVYVTNGTLAFDYEGWTQEKELLRETKKAYSEKYEGWDYKRIIIKEDIETFCKKYNHRSPSHFPYLPWERAYKYIKQFDSN